MKIFFWGVGANKNYVEWTVEWLMSIGHDVGLSYEKDLNLEQLNQFNPNILFSINYQPYFGYIAKDNRIPYVSWGVDAFVNYYNIPRDCVSEYSIIFYFNKQDCQKCKILGFKNVFYLPLAIKEEVIKYKLVDPAYNSNIVFIGSNYYPRNEYHSVLEKVPENDPFINFFNSLVERQVEKPSTYILPELLLEDEENGLDLKDFAQQIFPGIHVEKIKDKRYLASIISDSLLSHEADRIFRERLLKELAEQRVSLWGPESMWSHLNMNGLSFHGYCSWGNQMNRVLSSSKIGLNASRLFTDSVQMRVFEVMFAGSMCLSLESSELHEMFNVGKEIVLFSTINEARDKAAYYLKHESELGKITQKGYERVQMDHMLSNRYVQMRDILSGIGILI